MHNTGPLARIAARYLAGGLMLVGAALGIDFLSVESEALAADPQFIALAGLFVAGLTEGLYAIAKRNGWNT